MFLLKKLDYWCKLTTKRHKSKQKPSNKQDQEDKIYKLNKWKEKQPEKNLTTNQKGNQSVIAKFNYFNYNVVTSLSLSMQKRKSVSMKFFCFW